MDAAFTQYRQYPLIWYRLQPVGTGLRPVPYKHFLTRAPHVATCGSLHLISF